MNKQDISWKIGGEAGFGIMVTGLIFSKTFSRGGYHVFDYVEYPSLIRGGHNVYCTRISTEKKYSQKKSLNILVALNRETIDLHINELQPGSILIFDNEKKENDPERFSRKDINLYGLPLLRLAREKGKNDLTQNSVALGATIATLNYDLSILEGNIKEAFLSKSQKIVDMNIEAARGGYDYIKENYQQDIYSLKSIEHEREMVITGNEAISLGAIQAGCKFYVAYPMTPASSILHYLAANEEKYQIIVKHAEDEIAVMNMAIGAGFAGVRAMLATSGGGFSLMTEGLGLAGISETPIVAVVAERPGPATGMPTWTEQGDLKFLLNAAQGEFFRFVIAPGDIEECFYLTVEAFNLAEIFQTPVIIVTDKHLAESHWTNPTFDLSKVLIDRGERISDDELEKIKFYNRYEINSNCISPRSIPGQPCGMHIANSYEHDEYGYASEDAEMRIIQSTKRIRKESLAAEIIAEPNLIGPVEADITIVGWGSTKGAILDSLQILAKKGLIVNYLPLTFIRPFPYDKVYRTLLDAKKTIGIENNGTGQLAQVVQEKTGLSFDSLYLKNDGRPFYAEDIASRIMEVT